jgi:ADP-ribose pyrophosphatase
MRKPERPYELEIFLDEQVGQGGFLFVRRLHLRNRRPDGSASRDWLCDFVERPKGVDAVVLVLWRERDGVVEVLLREGLRPAAIYGRDPARIPIPDARPYFLLTELVAGIIEEGEVGLPAVQRRAVDEAFEEAGVRLAPEDVTLLGPAMFPSPGMTGEKFWFASTRVPDGAAQQPPEGDGSPMEEGARVRWVEIEEALAACARGEIEDAKTELGLRRFRERVEQNRGAR